MVQIAERSRRTFRCYPDVLTRKQASELLGFCEKTVSMKIKNGELFALQNGSGGKYLIPKVAVMRYLGIR